MLRLRTGVVRLPPGVFDLSGELRLPDNAHDLEIAGNGTTLRAADNFHGRAVLSCRNCRNLRLRNLTIDGNRRKLEHPIAVPASDRTFASTFQGVGVLLEGGNGLTISGVHLSGVPSFAVLVSTARDVTIENLTVESSGGHNEQGRNNTSGGILLEEGVTAWRVTGCRFRAITGNGVWTHSRFGSPRNAHGLIARNTFDTVGRDAIQVGHATDVRVVGNSGVHIGWPVADIDVEARATPVGVDTAGDVDASVYEDNRFEEIDGKCIDLDGFHDGVVRNNVCVNRGNAGDYPWGQYGIVMNNSAVGMQSRNIVLEGNQISGAKYGGIFIIGEGHRVMHNRLEHLNLAHCSEVQPACMVPGARELLSSGIYLGSGAAKPAPARGNIVEDNTVSGWKIASHCISYAPGVSSAQNTVKGNKCADE